MITLLYLNKNITTSGGILKHQTDMLHELKNRIEYHIDYYNTNQLVLQFTARLRKNMLKYKCKKSLTQNMNNFLIN